MERRKTEDQGEAQDIPPEAAQAEAIVATLHQYGIDTLPIHALQTTPHDSWQRIVVWHAKEIGLNPEEVGRACFGDEWQADTWI